MQLTRLLQNLRANTNRSYSSDSAHDDSYAYYTLAYAGEPVRGNLLHYHRDAGDKLDRNDSLDIATALALLGEYQAASERLGGITEKENSDSYPYSSRVSLAAHNLVRLTQLQTLWQDVQNDPNHTADTIAKQYAEEREALTRALAHDSYLSTQELAWLVRLATVAPKLAAAPRLDALYRDLEMPLAELLYKIEATGVRIDPAALAAQSAEISAQLAALEQAAHALAGAPFNLGSPKQLQEILYDQLGLPVLRKTPKGQPSTNEEVLAELAETHGAELPRLILEHRSLAKLKTTYTDRLPELINPQTERIHTSYHQAVTSTGRLSSSDPNLQNIPVRSDEGRRIRRAFIAEDGWQILAADYSQIELRIMAHLSADPGLLAAFARGDDIHRATAAEIFGVAPDAVSREQRRDAKAINFGLIYGMSAFGLARQLNIPRGQAAAYIDTYFARYPKVRDYMETTRATASKQGYVETLLGRRLYLPDINSKNPQRRQASERLAINAPMQGSAADIIKRAMLAIDRELGNRADLRLIMQVHDELVFEIRPEAAADLTPRIVALMEQAMTLAVPLIVDTGIGANWDEAH